MYTYQNPVIKGFNPDPSVCRAGDDFYLVTSTSEYFPGVPVYHSKNLVNWTLAGHCLTRREQLILDNARPSGGIYAPTIRFHNGRFCMTTTNVSHKGNFIVTAPDPRGPWGDPIWIDQPGIDPSLFFDDDGTAYFTSTATINGQTGIYLCALNPQTLEQQTPSLFLTAGSGGRHAEAPHLYRRGEYYYLLLAEGGTEYGHMVTIFRSQSVTGPYQPCPRNPILTHRDDGSNPIQCVGHADLFEDASGNWWLAALGVRTLPGVLLHNLGRETFLAPVVWDADGWPVVGNNGTLALTMSAPLPQAPNNTNDGFHDDFSSEKSDYLHIRNPEPSRYLRDASAQTLTLKGSGVPLEAWEGEPPVFWGIRQTEFALTATAEVTLREDGAKGGLAAYYGPDNHYRVYLTREKGHVYAQASRRVCGIEQTSERVPVGDGAVTLCIAASTGHYALCYLDKAGQPVELARGATAGLCTEGTSYMSFTGTLLGMFCETGAAVFKDFSVQ